MPTTDDGIAGLRFDFEPAAVDQSKPLIYLWEILDLTGVVQYRYVGKASAGAERPLRHYVRNVRNLLGGKPYRRGKPDRFRTVHIRLADAMRRGWPVRLRLLRNVRDGEDINSIERVCHQQHALDNMDRRGRNWDFHNA
jgi:hypothetical protein